MNTKTRTRNHGPLSDLIRRHYGAQTVLAQDLGVTDQTISNWIARTPRAILKHAKTIETAGRGITIQDLITAVDDHEKHLQR